MCSRYQLGNPKCGSDEGKTGGAQIRQRLSAVVAALWFRRKHFQECYSQPARFRVQFLSPSKSPCSNQRSVRPLLPSKWSNLHLIIECFPDLHRRETLPVPFRSSAQTLWEALNWTFIVNNQSQREVERARDPCAQREAPRKPGMLNMKGVSFTGETCIVCFSLRRLGMDIAHSLMICVICRARPHVYLSQSP